jgi:hypothetical protein
VSKQEAHTLPLGTGDRECLEREVRDALTRLGLGTDEAVARTVHHVADSDGQFVDALGVPNLNAPPP